MKKKTQEQKPPEPPTNDIYSEKFESKMDPQFTAKAKAQERWRPKITLDRKWL